MTDLSHPHTALNERVPPYPLFREDGARHRSHARELSELWDMMRGSRLGGEEQFAYPFLWNLMLDVGINDFPAQIDRRALDQLLAVFSSRSIIHEQACAWFQNILPRIPESDWIATMRQFGNWLTHVDKATAKPLIQDLLQEVEARAWRMTGWNSYPKELLAFIVEAARIPATGSVYVPNTPSFGLSRFLPSNAKGFFQFRSEHEAGIFAIHEVISEGHSAFAVADPRSEGTPFDESFSAAIAAPPLNERLSRNEDPTEIQCIKNALSVIKPGGRAVVCVGPSFLMRSGRYAEYRAHLTCSKLIEAVIQLPSRLLSGSSFSLSLLILDTSADRSKETLFIDASDCIVSGGSERVPQLDVEKLLTRFSDGQHPSCRRVDEEGIRAKEFDLTPARYIAQQEIVIPEHHRLCRFGELVSQKRFPRCQPGDRGVLLTQKLLTSQLSVEPQTFENLEVLDAEGFTHPATINRLDSDALIISPIYSKDGLGACLFHHNGKDLFLRSDMLTFEVSSNQVNPEWLMLALGSELTRRQIAPLASTAGIPRVRREVLMDLILAVPDTKEQQRALVALRKETALKSRAKELGLEEHLQSIKKDFLDDMRSKRHNLSQVVNAIKSAVGTLSKVLDANGLISAEQLISRTRSVAFREYLMEIGENCAHLGMLVENLTEESRFEPANPLNALKELKKVIRFLGADEFKISIQEDKLSFLDPLGNRAIKPIISIGENDFQILCRNIIENAKRHGFRNATEDPEIRIHVSLLHEKRMLELTFMNNGRPFPDGMDTRRFVLRGEKAGVAGHTGIGGYHIKSIMDHVAGTLEVFSVPDDAFPVQIKLQFPIIYDSSL
jgi:type I restriction-modification system DNA methylase subunit